MTSPTLVSPIPDQEHEPEQAVSFSVAAHFADAEDNGVLSFSASDLPSGLSISSSTGDITGSTSVVGTHTITVTATAPGGATRATQFQIVVQGAPSAAQEYHVNGTTGNDSWTGLSATFTSGTTGPWATITRANQVAAHASGHVDIMVAPGTYRNQPWAPQNGGTNNTHRIRLRVNGTGVVTLAGPTTGQIHYALYIERDFLSVLRESETTYFLVDGEVVFGTGAGQCQKGQDPTPFARLTKAAKVTGSDWVLEFKCTRLAGWNMIDASANTSQRGTARIDFDQCGTPYMDDGNDFGDGFVIWRGNNSAVRHLVDGGSSGRFMNRIGHSPFGIGAGSGAYRNLSMNNSWAGVGTFSSSEPDGNRCFFISQNCTDVHAYNCIVQRNGMPQDGISQNLVDTCKMEGTRSVLADSVLRNGRMQAIYSEAADWSHHCRGVRICHTVFEHFRGPLLYAIDWYDVPGAAGFTPLYDLCMKNIVARQLATNPRSGWGNYLINIWLASGFYDWEDQFPNGILHGFTLQDSSGRDWDDFRIVISNAGAPGNQTVQYYLTNYPNLFSNFTITTDANLDNTPTSTADADITDIIGEYVPVSDSLSVGQGVALTNVATADTGSGTSLIVDDATWFDDPQDGAPSFGEQSAGFYVHCNGANRQYTAINYATNTLTMSAGFSRSDGQAVNRKIASGSAPNRGIRGVL
jgi:hypothetical protein